jgi:hypothetical protein
MERDDRILKEFLQKEAEEVNFSQRQKLHLQQVILSELTAGRQSLAMRLVSKIRDFWHGTFDLNLAPVAAAAAVIILVGSAAVFGPERFVPGQDAPPEPVYMQQIVDSATVIFIPLERQ